jgi:hypothetical protein
VAHVAFLIHPIGNCLLLFVHVFFVGVVSCAVGLVLLIRLRCRPCKPGSQLFLHYLGSYTFDDNSSTGKTARHSIASGFLRAMNIARLS